MSVSVPGWNDTLEGKFTEFRAQGLEPARVSREDRERYTVLGARGESAAELAGRLRHAAASRLDLPAVGDWVALKPSEQDGPRTIAGVVPRAGAFLRQAVGDVTEAQVVAANVDVALVVAGLDGEFNPRRLERYVAAAWDSGAEPVLVLNKADLADDVAARVAEVELAAPGVAVVPLCAESGIGVEALGRWLVPGRTLVLLGSSGVGKSTLANVLLGEARQSTGAVRAHDSRGRHTTTRRELVELPGGAWLIDTPGMRELALWAGEEALSDAFPDVEALAAECRFGDCRHESEPGCAVRSAERDGRLDSERLASWRKLQRELHWLAMKQDQRLRAAETARWKRLHKAMKDHPKVKRIHGR